MITNNSLFKRIFLIFTAILLSQCTKVAESHLRVNQQLTSPYTLSAEAYLALAKNQSGMERQSLQIMAAGRLVRDGQWKEGLQWLLATNTETPEQLSEKNLLLAKIDLIRQQPKAAIMKLATIRPSSSTPLYYQVQYHELLATAYRSTGNVMEALNERVKLESLLPDESARSNNRRALWLMLTTLPAEELNATAIETEDRSDLDGWMQLAVISRASPSDVQETMRHLEQWKARYPNHPGNLILPASLAQMQPYLFASPKKIALLLPLTGKLAGPGNAVRDGFMQARDRSQASDNIDVRLYDTDKAPAGVLYQQAIAQGADIVVGPLGKMEVAEIAAMNHPVPTVLLNDMTRNAKKNAYQFGLWPSNEAMQVAARARKNGHTRALIIAPNTPWGDEISAAFTSQWRANGGQVVETMRYSESDNLAVGIQHLLQAREVVRSIRGAPVVDASATPRRRQDFDMIFLLAYPSKARQIMPMLRYYYAGDVPVYATSAAYSGTPNAQKDKDLEGLIFCDMPWVFHHQMGTKNWPEQWNSYNRLFALGNDSFMLATRLNQLLLFPAIGLGDGSGALYMNANQQIARVLAWGQMKQGMPQEVTLGFVS